MSEPLQKRNPAVGRGFAKSQTNGGGLQGHSSAITTLCGSDVRLQFIDAIRDAGVAIDEPDRITFDQGIIRFHVDGDRRGDRNGWAVLFNDTHGTGGAFGHWRTGETHTWRVGRGRITSAERTRLDAEITEARRLNQAQRRAREVAAQKRAYRLWNSAGSASRSHPYLIAKGIEPWDIRQLGDRLLIPVFDADGVLWTLEFIGPNGSKRFLTGGRKRGCWSPINRIVDQVLVCEGFATGASLYEATGTPVAVALDCGNLEPVALAIRAKYPNAEITLCADNDVGTPGNPGLTAATKAARAVGGLVAVPPEPYCDFNDAAVARVTHERH